jgi:hypothetical protein
VVAYTENRPDADRDPDRLDGKWKRARGAERAGCRQERESADLGGDQQQ